MAGFLAKTVQGVMIDWLISPSPRFKRSKKKIRKHDEHVSARTFIKDKETKQEFSATILLPHPKFASRMVTQLLDDYRNIVPPRLKIEAEEDIEIQGIKSKIYHHKGLSCSVYIPLVNEAVVNLYAETCNSVHPILTFADKIDLKGFQKRLQSG